MGFLTLKTPFGPVMRQSYAHAQKAGKVCASNISLLPSVAHACSRLARFLQKNLHPSMEGRKLIYWVVFFCKKPCRPFPYRIKALITGPNAAFSPLG